MLSSFSLSAGMIIAFQRLSLYSSLFCSKFNLRPCTSNGAHLVPMFISFALRLRRFIKLLSNLPHTVVCLSMLRASSIPLNKSSSTPIPEQSHAPFNVPYMERIVNVGYVFFLKMSIVVSFPSVINLFCTFSGNISS